MNKQDLVWQDPKGRWCCYQRHDIKVFNTKAEAEKAANRSIGSINGTKTRIESAVERRDKWYKFKDEKYRNGKPKI